MNAQKHCLCTLNQSPAVSWISAGVFNLDSTGGGSCDNILAFGSVVVAVSSCPC